MDGKSLLGILLLAAPQGTALTVSADGIDEKEAIEALTELVASGLGEHPWNA
jgi:phosphotransferase system HPr (HPr) family protein